MTVQAFRKKPHQPQGLAARMRSPDGLALAILCAVTLVFYHGLWLPGLILIKRDAFRFFPQLKSYLMERLMAGELPQWFPYEALGRPFIGALHTGIFHPFTVIYFLVSPPNGYRASVLLSCLLAAFGAFALGRRLGFSPAGALLAGIAFALSGYVVSLTDNLTYLYSMCVLPLFCAGLEKALAGDRMWVTAPAAIWATVFLNGDAQTGYYYAFIALLWAAMRPSRPYGKALLRISMIGVLAVLLAGIQLGPAWAVFMDSERTQSDLFREQALHWSMHPLRMFTVLAAPVGPHVGQVALGHYFFGIPVQKGLGGLWAESLYLGVPLSGLAWLGLRQRRDLLVLAFIGAFGLLLALGRFGGLYEVFYDYVPLWSAFRYPEKFMGFVTFAIAMLAGAGVDAMRQRKSAPAFWFWTALLCTVFWMTLQTDAAAAWIRTLADAPEALAHEVTSSAAVASIFGALGAAGMGLASAKYQKETLGETLFLVIMLTLITIDLTRVNITAYYVGPDETATFVPPLADAVGKAAGSPGPGSVRMVSLTDGEATAPPAVIQMLGHDGAVSVERRQALDLEHNAQFHIESLMPYLSGYSLRLASVLKKFQYGVAARYNVAYYIGRRSNWKDPQFAGKIIAELAEYDLALVRSPVPFKPRAYLSAHPVSAPPAFDPAELVAQPDFRAGDLDVIELSGEPLPGPARDGTALIQHYAPETVQIRVETPRPAVLILLDAHEQGWTATLETGRSLPILRANAVARAVIVPPGRHTVTFSYRTPLLQTGAWSSMSGALLSIGLIVSSRRRRTRPGTLPIKASSSSVDTSAQRTV